MIYTVHKHGLGHKLASHSIVYCMNAEENKLVSNMTLNMIQPKNLLSTLKRKRLENVSNNMQVYKAVSSF